MATSDVTEAGVASCHSGGTRLGGLRLIAVKKKIKAGEDAEIVSCYFCG